MEKITNTVLITEEARFDYLDVVGLEMPELDIKLECETYIEYLIASGKIGYSGYLHADYIDPVTEVRLKLFFYKGELTEFEQRWRLQGICLFEDYDVIDEEKGRIRSWLKTELYPKDDDDWVWDLRIREEQARREMLQEEENDMVKELLKNYRLNQSKVKLGTASEELKAQMELLDKCIEALDPVYMEVITKMYKRGLSLQKVGKQVGFSKTGLQYRRDKAIKMLEYLFGNT